MSYWPATAWSAAAIADALAARNVPFVVIEQNRERVQALRNRGWPAVSGDVSDPMALVQAHVADAGLLVIAVPKRPRCGR